MRALTAAGDDGKQPPAVLLVDPVDGGEVELVLRWPGPAERTAVRLRASEASPSAVDRRVVDLIAEVRLPDGRRVEARRQLVLTSPTTLLFEVYRQDDLPLTLAIEASTVVTTVVRSAPAIGAPVSLRLEIQKVLGERNVSLETNVLNTFVGESVGYEFRLGPAGEADAAVLRLTPLRIIGDIVEIDVELSGALPDGEETWASSRTQRWMTSRGTTSTLALQTGDPPTGYRFLVTPDF